MCREQLKEKNMSLIYKFDKIMLSDIGVNDIDSLNYYI